MQCRKCEPKPRKQKRLRVTLGWGGSELEAKGMKPLLRMLLVWSLTAVVPTPGQGCWRPQGTRRGAPLTPILPSVPGALGETLLSPQKAGPHFWSVPLSTRCHWDAARWFRAFNIGRVVHEKHTRVTEKQRGKGVIQLRKTSWKIWSFKSSRNGDRFMTWTTHLWFTAFCLHMSPGCSPSSACPFKAKQSCPGHHSLQDSKVGPGVAPSWIHGVRFCGAGPGIACQCGQENCDGSWECQAPEREERLPETTQALRMSRKSKIQTIWVQGLCVLCLSLTPRRCYWKLRGDFIVLFLLRF